MLWPVSSCETLPTGILNTSNKILSKNQRQATFPQKRRLGIRDIVWHLTVDIKPGQVGKEANKLNLKTDRQGRLQSTSTANENCKLARKSGSKSLIV
jgi:hypothetical protein